MEQLTEEAQALVYTAIVLTSLTTVVAMWAWSLFVDGLCGLWVFAVDRWRERLGRDHG